ncbi:MAG: prepilin peptidase [Armatimonadota bacterium]
MRTPDLIILAALGAILGSFANVLIHRLPRGESIVFPGSRCPHCGSPIRPWDNLPLVSFILLRGRCRRCGATIAWRYPLVEFIMATLVLAVGLRFRELVPFLSALILVFLLVVITFIDLDHQLILNRLTYPGIVIGLLMSVPSGDVLNAALAGLGAAALILAIVVLSRGGMGGGDVKLAALMGVFLGWPSIAVALFLAFLAGGVVGLLLLALRLRGRKDAIPFGPALAAGAVAALFWGDAIARWYWPR